MGDALWKVTIKISRKDGSMLGQSIFYVTASMPNEAVGLAEVELWKTISNDDQDRVYITYVSVEYVSDRVVAAS